MFRCLYSWFSLFFLTSLSKKKHNIIKHADLCRTLLQGIIFEESFSWRCLWSFENRKVGVTQPTDGEERNPDILFLILQQDRRLLWEKSSLVSTINFNSLTTFRAFLQFSSGLTWRSKHQLLNFNEARHYEWFKPVLFYLLPDTSDRKAEELQDHNEDVEFDEKKASKTTHLSGIFASGRKNDSIKDTAHNDGSAIVEVNSLEDKSTSLHQRSENKDAKVIGEETKDSQPMRHENFGHVTGGVHYKKNDQSMNEELLSLLPPWKRQILVNRLIKEKAREKAEREKVWPQRNRPVPSDVLPLFQDESLQNLSKYWVYGRNHIANHNGIVLLEGSFLIQAQKTTRKWPTYIVLNFVVPNSNAIR